MSQPFISKEILDYLQATFPNKLPLEPIPADALGVLIGQQKVVGHLAHLYRTQSRSLLAQP